MVSDFILEVHYNCKWLCCDFGREFHPLTVVEKSVTPILTLDPWNKEIKLAVPGFVSVSTGNFYKF